MGVGSRHWGAHFPRSTKIRPLDRLRKPKLSWYTDYNGKKVPWHARPVPKLFLTVETSSFEDGHVSWYSGRNISLTRVGRIGLAVLFKIPHCQLNRLDSGHRVTEGGFSAQHGLTQTRYASL